MTVFWRRWKSHLKYRPKTKVKQGKRKLKFNFRLLLVFLLGVFIFVNVLIEKRFIPVTIALASSRAKYYANIRLNEVVYSELENENIKYDDLFTIERNEMGAITAISANVVAMNKLKSRILIRAQDAFVAGSRDSVYVPLGSLIGSDLFVTMGPRMEVGILFGGGLDIDFGSCFESAGINQVKHEIYLEAEAEVAIVMPGRDCAVVVNSRIPITSAIIVGEVPEYVMNSGSTSVSVPSR